MGSVKPTLAVYGLGRLGLPFTSVLAQVGFDVVGVDNNKDRIEECRLALGHERSRGIRTQLEPNVHLDADNISFSDKAVAANVSFIIVPTPSSADGSFDDTYVQMALNAIEDKNPDGIAVIVSTVSPGTCQRLSDKHRLKIVYNPTFIALGSVVADLIYPDMLLVGGDLKKADEELIIVANIWGDVFEKNGGGKRYTFLGMYEAVELIKLSVNAYLGTKISFANSLGKLFKAYDVEPELVNVLTHDPRIGQGYLTPGAPISGPCLPRDNRALRRAAKEKNLTLPLAKATDIVNSSLINDIMAEIAGNKPASVGILGITYKHGTDVTEQALGHKLHQWLLGQHKAVWVYDEVLAPKGLEQVLACDVVVVTQHELIPTAAQAKGVVINPWR
jgi:UDPglucose 6-dehydrogenase